MRFLLFFLFLFSTTLAAADRPAPVKTPIKPATKVVAKVPTASVKMLEIVPSPNQDVIPKHFIKHTFFNNEHSFYIAESLDNDLDDPKPLISISVYDSNGELDQQLLQKFSEQDDYSVAIHGVEKRDINQDKYDDLIVHLSETYAGITNINSYFFINTHIDFVQMDVVLKQDEYKFLNNHVIRVSEPLYAFGTPYETEIQGSENTKENPMWINHYTIKGTELVLVNTKYMAHYEKRLKETKAQLNKTLEAIRDYKMDQGSPELNSLQLNELFHQVSTQKLIIQRCEAVIYLF